jgi:hypothetical protein
MEDAVIANGRKGKRPLGLFDGMLDMLMVGDWLEFLVGKIPVTE